MSDFIKQFVKDNKEQFIKYKKYIEKNDWTNVKVKNNDDLKYKSGEFDLQNELVSNIITQLKFFVKKVESDIYKYKTFTSLSLDIVSIHTDRVNAYTKSVDISDIENQDIRSGEVKFLKECFAKVNKIDTDVNDLNIKDDNQGDNIVFHSNMKAPLSMHEILTGGANPIFPEITRRLEAMNIDFISAPNNEMMIHMDSVPEWNPDKHYWEQDKETLQFYVDEFKKIKYGIVIDGIHIQPWLYYHINVFVTSYPITVINMITKEEETINKIGTPPLRDNEYWVIQDNYPLAKKKGEMLFLAATRRAAKTTMLASHIDWCSTIGKLNILCAGGATKDLDQIESNFKITALNKNSAFRVHNITDTWDKKVELGLKRTSGKNIISSRLHIINLNKGGDKSSEILAGYTPDAVIIDEIMKLPFIDQLAALKPALEATGGKRCVVILSGTAGNEELAKDAFTVLSDPYANDILEMQWEILNNRVPLEYRTWKERKFGTFIPAQMSAKEGLIKIDTNIKEYLKLENAPGLEKIKITDWGLAKEVLETARAKVKKDHKLYTKEVLYHPIDPEEMLLSSKINPFPREEAVRHLENLRLTGNTGRKVDITKVGGELNIDFSEKQLPKFPHIGGFHESPVVIFEDPPAEKPPRGLYVIALDDYKQEQSGTDSLGCFYVYKRQSGADEWGDRLVAVYTSRPDPHSKFHRIGFMLAEAYNADILMENEDMDFKLYLDNIHKTEEYLVPSFNLAGNLSIHNNGNRMYGISPKGNKSAIISKVKSYCEERIKAIGENGEEIELLGIERINDEMLLEEIINYKDGENHDRITTFGIALILAHKLNSEYVEAKLTDNRPKEHKTRPHVKGVLGGSRRRGMLG